MSHPRYGSGSSRAAGASADVPAAYLLATEEVAMTGSAVTAIGLAVVLAFVGVYDVVAAVRWGPEATVSRLVARVAARWPVVPLLVGIVLGHLFWPQEPPLSGPMVNPLVPQHYAKLKR